MNIELLTQTLEAWRKAYGIFRHISGPRKIGDAETVRNWLRDNGERLPESIRPGAAESDSVARMVCSFSSTSMNDRARKLRNGGGRLGRKLRSKAGSQAEMLKRYALENLAGDAGIVLGGGAFELVCLDDGRNRDLNLLTYANELIRRTEYASQGLSVYWLWLELDEDVRKNLTVASVQFAEQRLLDWLKHGQTATTQP